MFPRAVLAAMAAGLIGSGMAIGERPACAADPMVNAPVAVDPAAGSAAPSVSAPASRPTSQPASAPAPAAGRSSFADQAISGPGQAPAHQGPQDGGGGGPLGNIGTTLLSLFAVIALIVVVVWVVRKLVPGFRGGADSGPVRVLGKHYLAPKLQLFLVRIGERVVVIGAAGGHLSQVCQITDKDEIAELLRQCEQARSGSISNSFRSLFTQDRSKLRDAAGDEPDDPDGSADPETAEIRGELDSTVGRLRELLSNRRGEQ